jgi:hypothetical protein
MYGLWKLGSADLQQRQQQEPERGRQRGRSRVLGGCAGCVPAGTQKMVVCAGRRVGWGGGTALVAASPAVHGPPRQQHHFGGLQLLPHLAGICNRQAEEVGGAGRQAGRQVGKGQAGRSGQHGCSEQACKAPAART